MPEKINEADDAVLELLKATAKSVETTTKNLGERVDNVEKSVGRRLEDLDEKTRESLEAVANRLDGWEKRQSTMGRFTQGREEALASAVPEKDRHLVRIAAGVRNDLAVKDHKVGEDKPGIVDGVSALWMARAVQSMRPGSDPYYADSARSLAKALNDYASVQKADYAEGSQTTPGTGGYSVPEIVVGDILRIALDSSVVYSRARKIPMTSNQMRIPNEATGVTVYWTAEGAAITTGEPTQGQNLLVAQKLAGRAVVNSEQAEDSLVATMPYLVSVFGEAIGRELDQEALEGDGTNFTGVEAASGINTAGNVTGTTVTYPDLVEIMYKAGEESTRTGAAWFMNPQIFATVVGLVDTNGMPIFQYANIQNAPYPTILGKPVYMTNVLDVAQTEGSDPNNGDIYFGDPMTLIFGVNRNMTFGVSEHYAWNTDDLDFKVTGRWGFTVANPGAWTQGIGFTKIGG